MRTLLHVLPMIAPDRVNAVNKISQARLSAQEAVIDLFGLSLGDDGDVSANALCYRFRLGSEEGWLAIDPAFEADCLGAEAACMPEALRQILLLDACEALVVRLEVQYGAAFSLLDSPTGGGPSFADPAVLHLRLRRNEKTWPLQVLFDTTPGLDRALALLPSRRVSGDWDAVPFCVRFELGHTILAIGEARTLRPGDVIRIDAHPVIDGRRILIGKIAGLNNWAVQAADHHDQIEILDIRETRMTHDSTSFNEMGSVDSFDDLEISLRFEIAEMRMNFGQLKSLSPGQIVEVGQALSGSTVRIYVNDACLGDGDLVAVGDQLAVRIARLKGNGDA
ncbi:type III secretion system cytoplasmic ring protein SctQ [Herbaspirillum sp. RTI4]|uniref:type III secretion system cytoplasmic ring protein SctQ n=1 Tax=Herbaspirillum sp. RTI4 TaxID=3048640 RepID=UPI002AB3DEF7|nr:type III secretion system cytoplasmic ring protein SctQ [Herbaspirillum sp. RTI4]MDY7577157.1 type III secretion system cytoplasmic ring protein SctQ [Herbaspirillum sp. RTI4]MEA9980447.1 type III secretion system cytoplasmic ring protein SctQ [Herbaspirillum sp. RTI4]